MIFNSIPFVVFLVIVFTLHWLPLSRSRRHQNTVLLIGSYVFYGWWDPRFLLLILASSLIDYFIGLRIASTANERKRHIFLLISICANLGMLFFFKYFNFFVDTFKLAFGLPEGPSSLDIILPVGISFYTFQTMSYTIDVYRRQMEPTRNLPQFLTFVSFFPQLVAGPIERAKALLPQIERPRIFSHDNAVIGCRWILLGAFKKIVIADRIGPIVGTIFDLPTEFGGWLAFAGLALFFMQVYCDFSGYSDIAIGTAKLFNIDLMLNFDRPFFVTSLRKFWGRWHISLMTWLRDYLYIPIGGNRGSRLFAARNVMIVFLISGLWHGANWNFVIWGAWLGFFLLIEQWSGMENWRIHPFLKWMMIMVPFTFSMVFFRSPTFDHAIDFIDAIFGPGASLSDLPALAKRSGISIFSLAMTIALIAFLMLLEWLSFKPRTYFLFNENRMFRYGVYATFILAMGLFGVFTDPDAFIYFQF